MTQPYPTSEIFDIDRAEIALESWSWPFATDRSADIDRYFAELQSQRSGVWNGRVLLLNRYAIAERALRGACFETDYSSFITWRDREFPDPSVYNFFAAAVLRAADGGYLLGEMASYTAGAGRSYFPCGTPEPADVGAAVCSICTAIYAANFWRRPALPSRSSMPNRDGPWCAIGVFLGS